MEAFFKQRHQEDFLEEDLSRYMKDLQGLEGTEGGGGGSSFQRDEEQMPTSEGQIN